MKHKDQDISEQLSILDIHSEGDDRNLTRSLNECVPEFPNSVSNVANNDASVISQGFLNGGILLMVQNDHIRSEEGKLAADKVNMLQLMNRYSSDANESQNPGDTSHDKPDGLNTGNWKHHLVPSMEDLNGKHSSENELNHAIDLSSVKSTSKLDDIKLNATAERPIADSANEIDHLKMLNTVIGKSEIHAEDICNHASIKMEGCKEADQGESHAKGDLSLDSVWKSQDVVLVDNDDISGINAEYASLSAEPKENELKVNAKNDIVYSRKKRKVHKKGRMWVDDCIVANLQSESRTEAETCLAVSDNSMKLTLGVKKHGGKRKGKPEIFSDRREGKLHSDFISTETRGKDSEVRNYPRSFDDTRGGRDGNMEESDTSIKQSLSEGGALWDIFRREDAVKLQEYLQAHCREFRHIHCSPVEQVAHPIHDQSFYLNLEHKRKLKEEYGIEPWTFLQKLGEAVFIPAGCPHQVRNLKSCIKVALDFVSPENVRECIRLTEEFRVLPQDHLAKEDKLEVKKMALHALFDVVQYLQEPTKGSLKGSVN